MGTVAAVVVLDGTDLLLLGRKTKLSQNGEPSGGIVAVSGRVVGFRRGGEGDATDGEGGGGGVRGSVEVFAVNMDCVFRSDGGDFVFHYHGVRVWICVGAGNVSGAGSVRRYVAHDLFDFELALIAADDYFSIGSNFDFD